MKFSKVQKKFADEQACIDWLINERFGSKENMTCPHCGCNKAYNVLKWNYKHHKVNHSKGEYVRLDSRVAFKIHTNTIEGFWSHLKRGINGIYIWASKKPIDKYLLEFSYRYNKRHLDDFTRFGNFFQSCERKNLSYKKLIA